MQTDASEKKWPLLSIIGIVCVIALMAMIIQSLIHCFNPPSETKVEKSAVTAKTGETAAGQEKGQSSSVAGDHPFVPPVSGPASPPQLQPASPQSTEFNTDFKTIQEREKERRATIENMRKTIRSENTDSNIIMQEEKKLKKIEDSGASFM